MIKLALKLEDDSTRLSLNNFLVLTDIKSPISMGERPTTYPSLFPRDHFPGTEVPDTLAYVLPFY